ncbi:hypothetical protein AB0H63_22110 [Micromonospora echinospora]
MREHVVEHLGDPAEVLRMGPLVHALRRGMDGKVLLAAAGDGVGVTL